MSDSLWPRGLPVLWNSPGKNTQVGCHSLLQGIFLIQGSNSGMSHFRQVLNCLSHQGSPLIANQSKPVLNIHWKDWCWSWNSNTLATWWEEVTHWKRPWCWERLRAGGEGDDRGWDDWMASPTQWTLVWASSWRWWRTGKPGVLQSMGSQRLDTTERLNWTELKYKHMNSVHHWEMEVTQSPLM